MDIHDIKVYNPKDDGLDYKAYLKIKAYFEKLSTKAFDIFNKGLAKKVLNSKIDKNTNLREFLFGEKGYLVKRQISVIFLDGKHHSTYPSDISPSSDDLEKFAKATNSIPFAFSFSKSDFTEEF